MKVHGFGWNDSRLSIDVSVQLHQKQFYGERAIPRSSVSRQPAIRGIPGCGYIATMRFQLRRRLPVAFSTAVLLPIGFGLAIAPAQTGTATGREAATVPAVAGAEKPPPSTTAPKDSPFSQQLSTAALERTRKKVRYDPKYVTLAYPGGDVPANTGVCTDVVIRSFRALGIDLQKEVHEDMVENFPKYPKFWSLKRPDKNIDHRRVPNLQAYFKRHHRELPISKKDADYLPGDLVAWDLNGNGLWHIGIVVDPPPGKSGRGWFVHNIGGGPVLEQGLLQWKIVGHYRFRPDS